MPFAAAVSLVCLLYDCCSLVVRSACERVVLGPAVAYCVFICCRGHHGRELFSLHWLEIGVVPLSFYDPLTALVHRYDIMYQVSCISHDASTNFGARSEGQAFVPTNITSPRCPIGYGVCPHLACSCVGALRRQCISYYGGPV